MKAWSTLTVVLITLVTATTTAMAQKIYRCGSEYSQVPCPEAVVIEADDPRSSSQKLQSDAMVQRNAAAARALEKTRLEQEAALTVTNNAGSKKKKHASKLHSANTTTMGQPSSTETASEGGKIKKSSKNKEPAFFTARATPTPKKNKSPSKD